ncbi:MAG: hypothetical protein M3Y87_31250 [Myxococcota bacterium]|nr:hypothetical protein [Myxococcota bacterium]
MTNQDQDRDNTIEQAVQGVARIGRLWAVYGLEVGRAALRTSAETLKTTSEILGDVVKKIDERKPGATDDQAA